MSNPFESKRTDPNPEITALEVSVVELLKRGFTAVQLQTIVNYTLLRWDLVVAKKSNGGPAPRDADAKLGVEEIVPLK